MLWLHQEQDSQTKLCHTDPDKTRQKGLQSKLRSDGDVIICLRLRLLAEKRKTELVTRAEQDLHWSVVNCAGPQ